MNSLGAWVARLSEQPLPVWQDSREALLALAARQQYNGAALTRALAHDPLLCLQLLRRANSGRAHGSIATLEQAAVLLGAQPMQRLAADLPVLELEARCARQIDALRWLQRRAFHVGYLAREMMRLAVGSHFDDAFYAGLLQDVGELVLRAGLPAVAWEIEQRAARERVEFAEAAEERLGFSLPTLSTALAEQWRLHDLVRASFRHSESLVRRGELVHLAGELIQAAPAILQRREPDPRLQRAAEICGEPIGLMPAIVFRASAGATAWLAARLPVLEDGAIALYPPCRPAMAAPAAPSEAAAVAPLSQVLMELAAELREQQVFDRVLVALLTPDRQHLRVRFHCGIEAVSELARLELPVALPSLFARLLSQPAAVRVHPTSPAQVRALLIPPLDRVLAGEFAAQSLFVRGRAVGICYADRAGGPIEEASYARFRHQCGMLVQELSRRSLPGL